MMMAASLLVGSEAFVLPLPYGGGRSPSTSAVDGRASTPLASQPINRCRVPGTQNQGRVSRTR